MGAVYNTVEVTDKKLALDLVNHTPPKLIVIITHLFCQMIMKKIRLS